MQTCVNSAGVPSTQSSLAVTNAVWFAEGVSRARLRTYPGLKTGAARGHPDVARRRVPVKSETVNVNQSAWNIMRDMSVTLVDCVKAVFLQVHPHLQL